jgi:hypothetical protein
MRWQRQAEAAQSRWCDLTTAPDRFLELGRVVVPVVVLGHDFVDGERATFQFETLRTALAGNAGYLALRADQGDAELLGLTVSIPAGGSFDVQFGLAANFTFAGTGALVARSQSGDGRSGIYGEAGYELVPFPAIHSTPALTTFAVPIGGTILHEGYACFVKAAALNSALAGCFYFRTVGAPA